MLITYTYTASLFFDKLRNEEIKLSKKKNVVSYNPQSLINNMPSEMPYSIKLKRQVLIMEVLRCDRSEHEAKCKYP